MPLKIYNTLTHQKEDFVPINKNWVGIYLCGMTVQDRPHIGHIRAFITGDIVRRYLEYSGYKVKYIQNFTDIDDKIIERANKEGVDFSVISERYINEYLQYSDALGFKRADVYPKATDHIKEIIEMVQILINKGYAYQVDGDVYYDITKFASYGKLSRRNIEEMKAGARIDVSEIKRHPLDFALWKSAKEGEPYWDSPFGKGRPGWHIECSVMASKYLGETIDIHSGGSDLIFPHHENEIAQSEAASGKQFAKYWIHTGLLNTGGEKMSKSLKNFFAIGDILQKFSPNAIRFYLLSTHYRSPLEFSEQRVEESARGWERIENFFYNIQNLDEGVDGKSEYIYQDITDKFKSAMDDDFNTAQAIGDIFELIKKINSFIGERISTKKPLSKSDKDLIVKNAEHIRNLLSSLGFSIGQGRIDESMNIINGLMGLILEIRKKSRENKDWATADLIRNKLKDMNIVLEDRPDGTKWKIVSH